MKKQVDINCDMGEGFGHWRLTDAPEVEIMKLISSANIATGFHAGDPNSMDQLAQLCKEHKVGLGAHPGYRDLQGFGRRYIQASDEELINDITYQIGALQGFGQRHNLSLSHIKLHGALYMEAAVNASLSQQLIALLIKLAPQCSVYCMAGSETEKAAHKAGYRAVREFYADRDYDNSGSIVFTRKVGKLNPQAVADKCLRACTTGLVETVDGVDIAIPFESICFHSDTPNALNIGRAICQKLNDAGIEISAKENQR